MPASARVTLVQSDWTHADPARSLDAVLGHVRRHAKDDLVAFPELAVHGHEVTQDVAGRGARALRDVGPESIAAFHDEVARLDARVVYGRLRRVGDRFYNVATYVDARGHVDYAKTHVHWTEDFTPGDAFPVARTPLGGLGMLICYDAAFAEVGRALRLGGAELIVNLSAVPDGFPMEHVHRRVQACSVYNQVPTLLVNRAGPGFLGGSCVADHEGRMIAMATGEGQTLTVDVDLAAAAAWRAAEPVLLHRRPGVYGALTDPAGSGITK